MPNSLKSFSKHNKTNILGSTLNRKYGGKLPSIIYTAKILCFDFADPRGFNKSNESW